MPNDVYFWIVVIAVIAALGILAIWRWQKNVSVAVGPVSINTSDRDAVAATPDHVTVAKGAKVDGSVGEIVGRTGAGAGHGPTSVAEQLSVGRGGRIDRISGTNIGKPS